MEMNPEPTRAKAAVLAAYYAATRLVRAALNTDEEAAGADGDAALDDLWTGDAEENDARTALLIEALTDYAAVLALKAYGSRRHAQDEVFKEVWAMLPDEAAARALIARQLAQADEVLARG
jgi:hypothetical protein